MSSFMGVPTSVGFNFCGANHAGPTIRIGFDHASELLRRAGQRIEALLEQILANIFVAQDRIDMRIEQCDLIFGKSWRTEECVPDVDVDVRDAFVSKRWNVRRHGRTMRSAR